MTRRLLPSFTGTLLVSLLALGATTALLRAASLSSRYDAEVQRLRAEWRTQFEGSGLKRNELYTKYPTPELALCKPIVVAPGAKGALSLTGTFPDKAAFLVENDQVRLEGATVTATTYSATVSAAADAVPAFGRLYVYAPVSGAYTACGAVVVGAAQTYDLTATNGWKVRLTPQAPQFVVSGKEASLPYLVEYFKAGQTKPFETASGSLDISANQRPSAQFTMTTMPGRVALLMKELEVVQQQLGDDATFSKRPPKEQAAISAKLGTLNAELTREQEKADADPAAARRRQDDFGCTALNFVLDGPNVTGSIICSPKVGGSLRVTGTRK
jgi:hypothetical protein